MPIYTSRDASAPTISGTAGDLINLLDKILVAGYGAKAAAGWSKPFTGTNRASFKQGAGCGFYVDVVDDGAATGGARDAGYRGFETMTAVGTGTGLFPTVAQQANPGVFARKSDTADATVRQWVAYADTKTIYLFVNGGLSYYSAFSFGDFISSKVGDLYNCFINGRYASVVADGSGYESLCQVGSTSQLFQARTGQFFARGYNQTGTSVNGGKLGYLTSYNSSSTSDIGSVTTAPLFPNAGDFGLYIGRIYLIDPVTAPFPNIRGMFRGLWGIQHSGSTIPSELDFGGTGALIGRTFRVLGPPAQAAGNAARYLVETSLDTWDT